MRYWAMVDDDETCYVLIDECGLVHGYALQLEPDQWKWRTAAGEGVEANRDDAMDAAEDSLEEEK